MDQAKFNDLFNSLHIVQHREEFFWLVNEVENLNPRIIIEIGIDYGGSLKFWEQIVQPNDLIIGIDKDHNTPKEITWNYKDSDRRIELVIGSSEETSTIEAVKHILSGKEADFLYIDGDHSLMTCNFDFLNYSPIVKKSGIVGFHDLYTDQCNPKKIFDKIATGRKEERHLGGQGTGIWWKP